MTEIFSEGSNDRRFVAERYIGEQAVHGLSLVDEAALTEMEARHDGASAQMAEEQERIGWQQIDGEWYPPEYFG